MKCDKHGLVLDRHECSRCKDENKDKRIKELEAWIAELEVNFALARAMELEHRAALERVRKIASHPPADKAILAAIKGDLT